MSDNQNWAKMGEDIKDALSEALKSGDFTNLNELVSQSAVNALNEVGKHIPFVENSTPGESRSFSGDWQQTGRQTADRQQTDKRQTNRQSTGEQQTDWQQKAAEREAGKQFRQQQEWQRHLQRRQEQMRQKERLLQKQEAQLRRRQTAVQKKGASLFSLKEFKRVGNVSNVLYQVFGGIGLGVTLLVGFVLLVVWASGLTVSGAGFAVNLLFLLGFLFMIRVGVSQRKRLQRAERYLQLCGHNKFVSIESLAKGTGKKARKVIKDIRKMLSLGMFPEGHLDEQKTCFMLTDEIYHQYQEAEESRRIREAQQQKALRAENGTGSPGEQADQRGEAREQFSNTPSSPNISSVKTSSAESGQEISGEQKTELNTMVAEGMECIRKLRELNDEIPGEVISAKLFRLEGLLKDIFDSLREHPEQMHRMHRLMDYYLPTTLKLVEAYADFDKVSTPGDDIIKAKAEIENTLDTINQAFVELLNNLFQDAVLDATTDAQVLKTMLAREGLMREMDFQTEK